MKKTYSSSIVTIVPKLASAVVHDILSGAWSRVDYFDPMPVINKISNMNETMSEELGEAVCHLANLVIASSTTGHINIAESKSMDVLREYFSKNNYNLLGFNGLGLIFQTALCLMRDDQAENMIQAINKDEKDLF